MKISYNWLKEYLDIDLLPEEAENKLTLLGLEVEGTETFGAGFDGVVTGEILEVSPHPNADRLRLCRVNIGSQIVQIVCGADNVAAGQKVPVATVGSVLPVPMKNGSLLTIKKAKLRGEISEGMICAEDELGLGDDHSGIMVLDNDPEAGTPLSEALGITKDTVFEIALTPNRPDAACHIGVARDLSAGTGVSLTHPYQNQNIRAETQQSLDGEIDISIENPEKCHRYAAMLVDNVRIGDSPQWLKNRLTAIGLRPVNNVVDITNFVMHEVGQPLHAFDYDRIAEKKIHVKSFSEERRFTTLDGAERRVPAGSLFICDGSGPVAIAGVMGGENSEVTGSTTKILIESAWFEPSGIRKTSKALALQTDSSYRFERGIDPNLQVKAAHRAAKLIAKLTGGTIRDGHVDIHPVKTAPLAVDLRVSRVNHLLGTDIGKQEISGMLNRLDIKTEEEAGNEDVLTCTIPTFRPDISREVDLIEETGRVYDYNNIPRPEAAPFVAPEPLSGQEKFQERLRHFAKNLGYKEISTNSLISEKEANLLANPGLQIHTLNPVSRENTTLRTHLAGGFLKSVQYNLNRNASNIRFFELGHVFRKSPEGTWIEGVEEHLFLLLGLCGMKKPADWRGEAVPYTLFDLKGDLEALFSDFKTSGLLRQKAVDEQQLNYVSGKTTVAVLKKIGEETLRGFDIEDQGVFIAEIDLTELLRITPGTEQNAVYTPVPRYPSFEFDAAFTVDSSVAAGELMETITGIAGNKLHSVSVFDVYEGKNLGKNKKSIAFRLSFLDSNKTLNIKDVEPIVKNISQALEKSVGAKLRS